MGVGGAKVGIGKLAIEHWHVEESGNATGTSRNPDVLSK